MRACILGSKGFLGYNLVSPLEHIGCDIVAVDRHLWDLTKFGDYFRASEPFDLIFHCASTSNLKDQEKIDENVIKWVETYHSSSKLVTFGSDALYDPDLPRTEDFYANGDKLLPAWAEYGEVKKKMFKRLIDSDLKWNHFVLTSMFGEGFPAGDTHFVHSVIKKFFGASPSKFVEVGDPHVMREIVYVRDAARNVVEAVMYDEFENKPVNLGSPLKITSTEAIVEEIRDSMIRLKVRGIDDYKIVWDSSITHHHKFMNSHYAIGVMGDKYNDTDLETSIDNTVRYADSILRDLPW